MKLTILDEDKNNLVEFNIHNIFDNSLNKINKIVDIDEGTKNFLNNLNYGVIICTYIEKLDDFYVSFVNDKNLEYASPYIYDYIGNLISDITFSFDKEKLILKTMQNVYHKNQTQNFFFKYYDNIIIKQFNVKLIKVNNYIYILKEDKTDFVFLTTEEEDLFNNNVTGISVIQDYHYVKCNKKYLELIGNKSFEEVIGKKVGYSGLINNSVDILYKTIDKVIDKHMYSYSLPIELETDKEITYLKLNCNYDIYKGKSAIMIFYNNITEEIKYQNQLKDALNDKEVLLTEVHHRVKNNLQIILSLINLEKNYKTDTDAILNDTENRIYSMALIHEKIYGSTSLSDVNMKEYIELLVDGLLDTYWSDITFNQDIEPINLDMDLSIPLGLIINELVTNTIKHAFTDNENGSIYIKFKKENELYVLTVEDDGVGLPNNFDLDNLSTLGLIVVQNLINQIDGTFTIIDCEGTGFKIEFN